MNATFENGEVRVKFTQGEASALRRTLDTLGGLHKMQECSKESLDAVRCLVDRISDDNTLLPAVEPEAAIESSLPEEKDRAATPTEYDPEDDLE